MAIKKYNYFHLTRIVKYDVITSNQSIDNSQDRILTLKLKEVFCEVLRSFASRRVGKIDVLGGSCELDSTSRT